LALTRTTSYEVRFRDQAIGGDINGQEHHADAFRYFLEEHFEGEEYSSDSSVLDKVSQIFERTPSYAKKPDREAALIWNVEEKEVEEAVDAYIEQADIKP